MSHHLSFLSNCLGGCIFQILFPKKETIFLVGKRFLFVSSV
ncbi:hypothetical protein RUMCAL_01704 [Ruminococcus callidus ATCC 27760]|uniref:Uncharacterized protein n=1 Tax=Ruminococcus callidus ATCC 27760 TaxID=411473 RepID=U2M725_9FIRM|nr:hypothetical protein RUMCAL_01704 [Ruminococcus callidus ATCC 27760]